jgi:hypothetical protein
VDSISGEALRVLLELNPPQAGSRKEEE